jgi:putative ABC transport system permease protein
VFYLTIGLRNILKNLRRSLFTATAVGAGFSAISLFSGYIHYVYHGLMLQAVRGEGLAHLTIARHGFFDNASLNPEDNLLTKADLVRLGALLEKQPETVIWAPQLAVSGMMTNGHASTIFVAEGLDAGREATIRGSFRLDRGGILDPNFPAGICVSGGLAKLLSLNTSSRAVLFTNTVSGQANAIDVDVHSLYDTGVAATNDKSLRIPLAMARKLYDVDGADRVRLLLKNEDEVEPMRVRLASLFKSENLSLDIRDWKQLSAFYRQVKTLFDTIFSFIFSIVVIVVIMSVVNTMSMTVIERTREIGTLRALGMKRPQIVTLFSVEALLLAAAGVAVGFVITLIVVFVVNSMGVSYVPPGSSDRVPLLVDILPGTMAVIFLLLAMLTAVAALFPASGASRKPIVDALGHV